MKLVAILTLTLVQATYEQDFDFPADDESYAYVSGGKPITERKPLNAPDKCPENMLLYSDDGPKSSWVCDCRPRYVYFPQNNSCHEAFYQGPCPIHHFVYLAPNDTLPTCVKNSCLVDGVVRFRNYCQELRVKGGPCGSRGVLSVNETTFQLECMTVDLVPFAIIDVPKRNCPAGSRRNRLGACKIIL